MKDWQGLLTGKESQSEPKYKELCRRFLADEEDFSERKNRESRYKEKV